MKGKKIISWLLILLAVVFFSGCGCKQRKGPQYSLKLEVWGLFDDSDTFDEIFDSYRKVNPNIAEINYRKLTSDNYKKELVDALASGQGPDVFLIHNTWLNQFKDKTSPAPAEILNEQTFRNNFVDTVISDFLFEGKVFAVPLTVDSLGLYYNKDLFNEAGITNPPTTWEEFVQVCEKLSQISSDGRILQSGAAIGTAYNINRSSDLLGLLMLQNRTQMVDLNSRNATFNQAIIQNGENISPGKNALKFYTQFARAGTEAYSWNTQMHYSLDAFSEGTVAMMFNYSWHRDTITQKTPGLNFEVAPVPQLPGNPAVDYSNYWGFAVAKNKIIEKTDNPNPNFLPITNEIRISEAWKFLNYLTTKPEQPLQIANAYGKVMTTDFDPAKNYVEKTRKPAGRRDLIENQKTDAKIGVFAQQNLIARSWYQVDPEAIEAIFAEMIDKVNRGQASEEEALNTAASQVGQLMYK